MAMYYDVTPPVGYMAGTHPAPGELVGLLTAARYNSGCMLQLAMVFLGSHNTKKECNPLCLRLLQVQCRWRAVLRKMATVLARPQPTLLFYGIGHAYHLRLLRL
jgi:hypothetical protein